MKVKLVPRSKSYIWESCQGSTGNFEKRKKQQIKKVTSVAFQTCCLENVLFFLDKAPEMICNAPNVSP